MASPPQTARSERTRAALRKAATVRFLAQGVEATSAEEIAADAGVTLRTFYRHFASKHDLLFADYDSGLQWFRKALAERPADENVIASVQAAIFAFPYDVDAVTQIANLRVDALDPSRIVQHMRQVQSDFAHALLDHLRRRHPDAVERGDELDLTVAARSITAAVFAAMEVWLHAPVRSLPELARLSREATALLEPTFRHY
ncbi:TetR family transcriptional regulator [Nocardioides silvaticus]|uniref:TetR family transcriptional regulator n=1 Tax=Nocardioides silvaticus TaxID=2201891 RepID=A0A316TK67_9ACTN|nr:TetR/AcrR family transcriptional regulator [Nocardioides silvaticus]PWN02614.1 TetR family transcriptional regulator [Nocardioides silvaticus]